MSISPIRIPTDFEFDFTFTRPTGSPLHIDNQEWESVLYEVWDSPKIYRYVMYQLQLLKDEVRMASLTGRAMSESDFAEKRDLAVKGLSYIHPYLKANQKLLNQLSQSIAEVYQVAAIYRNVQKRVKAMYDVVNEQVNEQI